ncbi:unnamed protein product, partial [Pelagomonas calceolata]
TQNTLLTPLLPTARRRRRRQRRAQVAQHRAQWVRAKPFILQHGPEPLRLLRRNHAPAAVVRRVRPVLVPARRRGRDLGERVVQVQAQGATEEWPARRRRVRLFPRLELREQRALALARGRLAHLRLLLLALRQRRGRFGRDLGGIFAALAPRGALGLPHRSAVCSVQRAQQCKQRQASGRSTAEESRSARATPRAPLAPYRVSQERLESCVCTLASSSSARFVARLVSRRGFRPGRVLPGRQR